MPGPPDPQTRLARSLVRGLLRVVATTAIAVAGVYVATYWPHYANQRKLAALGMERMPLVSESFGPAVWLFAGGVWLLILDRSLLWWLVPGSSGKCPQCKYDLKGLTGDKCPECGLQLR
jgi:hypothetical protein